MSLNCNHVRDLVTAYKDGAVSEETHRDVRRHLAGCADCRRYYREYDRMESVVYVPDSEVVPTASFAAVASRMRRRRAWNMCGGVVTAALLVAATAWIAHLRHKGKQKE